MEQKPWSLYIVECRDKKLYTGISNDVIKRVKAHNKGKGCRFTKCRFPVELVYQELCGIKSDALKREIKIQSFSRSEKIELINKVL
jgi:putative endonuclease